MASSLFGENSKRSFSSIELNQLIEGWGKRRPRVYINGANHSLLVDSGGFYDFIERPRNGRHSHPHFELCYVLEGEGYFCFQQAKSLVRQGDVFLADPTRIHEIDASQSQNLRLFFFGFALDKPDSQLLPSLAISDMGVQTHTLSGHYGEVSERILDRFRTQHLLIRRRQDHLLHLLSAACSNASVLWEQSFIQFCLAAIECLCRPSSELRYGLSEQNAQVRKALDYIESELRFINADKLAQLTNTSPRHLYRLFHTALGRSPKDEILRRKILRAEEMLKMNLPVKEVAFQLGIADPANFSRLFKKLQGISPAQYRKRYSSS